MTDLVIFGSGGFAREVLQVALDQNDDAPTWNVLGFLDGNPESHGTAVHDLPVLGGADWLAAQPGVAVVIGVGATPARRRIARAVEAVRPTEFATLVHPRAWTGRRVALGPGTVVCAGSLLTTDIKTGQHVVINLDCTVGHDSCLADFVTAAPSVNVSGDVMVGEGCDLGTGAVLIQGVTVGAWTVIGAGAVVVRDLPPNVTAVGAPARAIKERPAGWHD